MRILANVLCIILIVFAFAQASDKYWIEYLNFTDFNSSGIGARSKAMGGTCLALDNGAFGSFENPATMVMTNKSLMSANLSSYNDYQNMRYGYLINSTTNPDTNVDLMTKLKKETHRLDQFGAVAPFAYAGRDWWVGGGYHTAVDFNLKWNGIIPADYNNGSLWLYDQEMVFNQEKSLDILNAALATNIMQSLSIGVNFNYYTRRYEGDYWDGFYTDEDIYIGIKSHFKSNFSGINTDIGLHGHFDKYAAGLIIRTPFILRVNGFNTTALYIGNPGIDGNGPINRVKVKYHFPLSYAFGVSANPIEPLTLAADIDMKPYSKTKLSIHYEDESVAGVEKADANWNDMTQIRIGAEYVLNAGFAKIPIRAGYHNLPLTQFVSEAILDTMRVDTTLTTQATNTYSNSNKPSIFSFGAGLKFERIWLDLAYEFGSAEYDKKITYGYFNPALETVTTEKYNYSRLYLSVGMLF